MTQSWPGTPEHKTAILLGAEAMSSLVHRNGLLMTSPSPEFINMVQSGIKAANVTGREDVVDAKDPSQASVQKDVRTNVSIGSSVEL